MKNHEALSNVISYINKNPNIEVIAFYNGEDAGENDTENDVIEHYLENGLLEDRLDNINFHEKTYAFLRPWMDEGIDNSIIIKTVRYLIQNRLNQTSEIEPEDFKELLGKEDYEMIEELDEIYLINLPIADLKVFSGALIGGGGRSECFHEIQIVLSVFNIKYKEVQEWIY